MLTEFYFLRDETEKISCLDVCDSKHGPDLVTVESTNIFICYSAQTMTFGNDGRGAPRRRPSLHPRAALARRAGRRSGNEGGEASAPSCVSASIEPSAKIL